MNWRYQPARDPVLRTDGRYYGINDPVAEKMLRRAEDMPGLAPPDDKTARGAPPSPLLRALLRPPRGQARPAGQAGGKGEAAKGLAGMARALFGWGLRAAPVQTTQNEGVLLLLRRFARCLWGGWTREWMSLA